MRHEDPLPPSRAPYLSEVTFLVCLCDNSFCLLLFFPILNTHIHPRQSPHNISVILACNFYNNLFTTTLTSSYPTPQRCGSGVSLRRRRLRSWSRCTRSTLSHRSPCSTPSWRMGRTSPTRWWRPTSGRVSLLRPSSGRSSTRRGPPRSSSPAPHTWWVQYDTV